MNEKGVGHSAVSATQASSVTPKENVYCKFVTFKRVVNKRLVLSKWDQIY